MSSHAGRVVAVTGASSGIGAETARQFAAAGARVVLGARRDERLADMVEELGPLAHAVHADVSRPEDCEALVQAAISQFGGLDVIVVNAGVGFYGSILDHTEPQIRSMLDTNISGTVWSIRAALPALMKRGGGDIVIVCSVAGSRAGMNEAVYAATKHAQLGLAQGLDRDLHRSGIRVTAICPGGVVTEFAMGEGRTPESAELAHMLGAEHVAAAILSVVDQPRSVRTLVHSLRGILEPDA